MKDKSWLAAYALGDVTPINSDPTFAIFTASNSKRHNPSYHTLRIPNRLESDPLCLAIVAYCKSEPFLSQASITRKGKYQCFIKLFNFLDEKFGEEGECDLTALHPDWTSYLKKRKVSIQGDVATVNTALKWYLATEKGNKRATMAHARVNATQKRVPKISRQSSATRKALSELSKLEYDDQTLVKSLRMFCVVMLKILREQRSYLLSNAEVKEARANINKLTGATAKQVRHGYIRSVKADVVEAFIRPLWNAISSSDNPLLIERLLLNCPLSRRLIQNSKGTFTLEEQKELMKLHLTRNGFLRRDRNYLLHKAKKGKVVSSASFDRCSYESLDKPIQAEKVLISWLLASERIQLSGQIELKVGDYYISGETGSWDFGKNRSTATEYTSQMYSKGSAVHNAYKEYIALASTDNEIKSLAGVNPQPTQLRLTFERCSHLDPILSVALKGSYLRSWLLKKYPITKPFIELITDICTQNDIWYLEKDKGQTKGSTELALRSLGLSYVAQSVAIINDKRGVREKQSAYEMFSQSEVNAALNAHTSDVRQNIYINRSEALTRINERKWFSEIVSEEMIKDAQNLIAVLSNSKTKVVSLSEARNVLGLKGFQKESEDMVAFSELLKECEKHETEVGCFGDIKTGSEKLIVELPITAALMLSYQAEIKKKLQEQIVISNRQKAYYLSRYIYIDGILNSFEPHTVKAGIELMKCFDIPAPPIFVEKL
ncbi:hypothetical protein LY624_10475 [Pseudoalteromonas sp. N1230-9]|uniref:hypothetical protein n=1 Tax=Pseudoalteromonas sp. N1230-9 TaxID=2907156 RepID=UPI002B31834A|nr:hypothetical protein LY624_10475 [Pseudoalteromonas sp. N1230-9]